MNDNRYELGCNVYITRPVDYDQFAKTIQRLSTFVLISKTPGGSDGNGRGGGRHPQ